MLFGYVNKTKLHSMGLATQKHSRPSVTKTRSMMAFGPWWPSTLTVHLLEILVQASCPPRARTGPRRCCCRAVDGGSRILGRPCRLPSARCDTSLASGSWLAPAQLCSHRRQLGRKSFNLHDLASPAKLGILLQMFCLYCTTGTHLDCMATSTLLFLETTLAKTVYQNHWQVFARCARKRDCQATPCSADICDAAVAKPWRDKKHPDT